MIIWWWCCTSSKNWIKIYVLWRMTTTTMSRLSWLLWNIQLMRMGTLLLAKVTQEVYPTVMSQILSHANTSCRLEECTLPNCWVSWYAVLCMAACMPPAVALAVGCNHTRWAAVGSPWQLRKQAAGRLHHMPCCRSREREVNGKYYLWWCVVKK